MNRVLPHLIRVTRGAYNSNIMTNKKLLSCRFQLKATLVSIVLLCSLLPQIGLAQAVDFTDSKAYPSDFPKVASLPTEKSFAFTTTDDSSISLYIEYCGHGTDNAYLSMYKEDGVIKYTTKSAISAVIVKVDASQAQSGGALQLKVGTKNVGTQETIVGGKTYIFSIDKQYQEAGKAITLLSTGKQNVKLDQISFVSASANAPSAPTFSIESGTYPIGQEVELSAESGCSIFYTMGESTSATEYTVYDKAIKLSKAGTYTISAIAVNADDVVSDVATATYKITNEKAAPTFKFDSDESSFMVEYSDASNFVPPTLTNESGLEAAYSSSNTDVAEVNGSTGTLTIKGYGTTVITASVGESDTYKAATASYKLIITDYIETYELLTDASTLAAGDVLLIANGTKGKVYLASKWIDGRLNVDATAVTISDDGFISAPSSDAARLVLGGEKGKWTLKDRSYYWMATGGASQYNASNKLTGSTTIADCGYATISIASDSHAATIVFDNAYSNTIYYYDGTATPIFSCYSSTFNDPVYLFRKVERVKIGSHGVSSFSSSNNLRFAPTEIKPYTATEVSEGLVTLTPFNKVVPRQTGVMLKGTAGSTVSVPVANTASSEVGTNMLLPVLNGESIAASTDEDYHYLFGTMDGETAFFKLETDYTSNANRCYLETTEDIQPKDPESKGLTMRFADEEVNSITTVSHTNQSKAIYTLSGQRVTTMSRPGIYIVDGRKIIKK